MSDPIVDTGVSWVRTRLAWARTFLTLSVVALLAARFAVRHGTLGIVFAAVAVAGWAASVVWVARRARRLSGSPHPVPAADTRTLLVGTGIGLGYAVLGAVMILVL